MRSQGDVSVILTTEERRNLLRVRLVIMPRALQRLLPGGALKIVSQGKTVLWGENAQITAPHG
jgi:hypothetical protein